MLDHPLPAISLVKFSISPETSKDVIDFEPDLAEKITDLLMWPARLYFGETIEIHIDSIQEEPVVSGSHSETTESISVKFSYLKPNSNEILKKIAKVVFAILLIPLAIIGALFGAPLVPYSTSHMVNVLDANLEYAVHLHGQNKYDEMISNIERFYPISSLRDNKMINGAYLKTYDYLHSLAEQHADQSEFQLAEKFLSSSLKLVKTFPSKVFRTIELSAKVFLMHIYYKLNRNEDCDRLLNQTAIKFRHSGIHVHHQHLLRVAHFLLSWPEFHQKSCNIISMITRSDQSNINAKLLLANLYITHYLNDEAGELLNQISVDFDSLDQNQKIRVLFRQGVLNTVKKEYAEGKEKLLECKENIPKDIKAMEPLLLSINVFMAICHARSKEFDEVKKIMQIIQDFDEQPQNIQKIRSFVSEAKVDTTEEEWEYALDEIFQRNHPDFIHDFKP